MKPHTAQTIPAARGLALLLLLPALFLAGCATTQTTDQDPSESRSAGYSALYDLLNRNAGISKLLVFKSVAPPVKQAIDDFAKLCADSAKQLKQFADDDDSIDLKAAWLTPIEKQTRASIESATSTALLTSFGDDFQTHLLLSQTSAAEYGSHLAQTLAKLEENPDYKKALTDLADQLNQTHQRLFKLIEPAS